MPSSAALRRALAVSADRAQRMADAFGLTVPVEGDALPPPAARRQPAQASRRGKVKKSGKA